MQTLKERPRWIQIMQIKHDAEEIKRFRADLDAALQRFNVSSSRDAGCVPSKTDATTTGVFEHIPASQA